jgi:hypothetical protein
MSLTAAFMAARNWRGSCTPLQLTTIKTREIVQCLRRCRRGSGRKPARRLYAAKKNWPPAYQAGGLS